MNPNRNQPADVGIVFTRSGGTVFAWTGLLLACMIGSIVGSVKIMAESTWTKWKAEVVRTSIISSDDRQSGDLRLEYRYLVNGKPFTVTEQAYQGKMAVVETKRANYEKRRFIVIRINPSNPAEARIDNTNAAKMIALFMFCSLLSGLGFACGIRVLFFPKNADPIPRTR